MSPRPQPAGEVLGPTVEPHRADRARRVVAGAGPAQRGKPHQLAQSARASRRTRTTAPRAIRRSALRRGRGGEQLLGVVVGERRVLEAAEHPGQLAQPGLAVDQVDLGRGDRARSRSSPRRRGGRRTPRPAAGGSPRATWAVRASAGEPPADLDRGPAADAGVDLVEDEARHADRRRRARSRARASPATARRRMRRGAAAGPARRRARPAGARPRRLPTGRTRPALPSTTRPCGSVAPA